MLEDSPIAHTMPTRRLEPGGLVEFANAQAGTLQFEFAMFRIPGQLLVGPATRKERAGTCWILTLGGFNAHTKDGCAGSL